MIQTCDCGCIIPIFLEYGESHSHYGGVNALHFAVVLGCSISNDHNTCSNKIALIILPNCFTRCGNRVFTFRFSSRYDHFQIAGILLVFSLFFLKIFAFSEARLLSDPLIQTTGQMKAATASGSEPADLPTRTWNILLCKELLKKIARLAARIR